MTCPNASGFSLVELLVSLAVCALLSGAIAAVAPHARLAFDSTPQALDVQQRERTAADVMTRALRSAALLAAAPADGTAGVAVPAVELLEPDEDGHRFRAVRILAIAGPGRGVLEADQGGASGPLRLRPDVYCPTAGEVCGFSEGEVAAIVNVAGGFDVFTVGSTSKGANSLAPASSLGAAYRAGSTVFQVTADTYFLDEQADGSFTLVRETAGGAVQPVVDDVEELSLGVWRADDMIKRVDVAVRMAARSTVSGRVPARTRRLSIALRNPS